MTLSNIALAIDIEHDNGKVIEIGLTEINLTKKKVERTLSIPVYKEVVSDRIAELTGWTTKKLHKQAVTFPANMEYPQQMSTFSETFYDVTNKRTLSICAAVLRLKKYGIARRLIITDSDDEMDLIYKDLYIEPLENKRVINTITLLKASGQLRLNKNYSLPSALEELGLKFEGRLHSGKDDSLNIARLFLAAIKR
jgi:hypothetical protein